MKVAVVGSGISGLSIAHLLQLNGHEVHLFEKGTYFGGHANTIDITVDGQTFPVDTGFLVHNDTTYPNLIQYFKFLGVKTTLSEMTFSIRHLDKEIEWGGKNLSTVFSQRKNIINPSFLSMLFEILDLNKRAQKFLETYENNTSVGLGDFLMREGYSDSFKDLYIIPMAAAIWSTPADKILDFPAGTFLRFCINHHLLQVQDRPQWKSIHRGSRTYVENVIKNIANKYLNTPVLNTFRDDDKVRLETPLQNFTFDKVVFATHANQTLSLIANITNREREILEKFKYQPNLAVVHSDPNYLPTIKKNWSAWNYLADNRKNKLCVSYLINCLQPLPTDTPIIVTLNPTSEISPQKIYKTIQYAHPLFDGPAIEAQKLISEIQGYQNTYYCGAWCGYGFHEDGLKAALKVARLLNLDIPWNAQYE